MKIRVNKNDTDVGSIKVGECFWYGGNLYIKVDHSLIINTTGAVNLNTGILNFLDKDLQVEKADCMVVSAVDKCQEVTEKGKWEV